MLQVIGCQVTVENRAQGLAPVVLYYVTASIGSGSPAVEGEQCVTLRLLIFKRCEL